MAQFFMDMPLISIYTEFSKYHIKNFHKDHAYGKMFNVDEIPQKHQNFLKNSKLGSSLTSDYNVSF